MIRPTNVLIGVIQKMLFNLNDRSEAKSRKFGLFKPEEWTVLQGNSHHNFYVLKQYCAS